MWRSKRSACRTRSRTALRCLRPGGTLSSLGVYSGKLQVPYDAFAAGIGDYKIVTTLCPGGKERMRRLMSMVQSKRFDPTPLLTHSFQARSNRRGLRPLRFAARRRPESCDSAMNTTTRVAQRKPLTANGCEPVSGSRFSSNGFDEIGIEDIPMVGGKTASLGEMFRELAPQGRARCRMALPSRPRLLAFSARRRARQT